MTQTPTEYTALNFDGTERRGNYRTVAYRIDILHICEHKDAAAILFEIIYRWQTEVRKPDILKEIERRKKAGQPPLTEEEVDSMMWVWMSYNDFVRECGGAIGYNTVIRMLDYLVETAQLIECRENHDPRYPDYEYRIRMDVLKEKLKALPAAPAFLPKVPKKKENKGDDSTQMGTPQKRSTQKGRRAQKSTQVGIVSTQMGTATTQMGTEVYPFGGTSHTYSHTSHIEHTEEEGTLPAHESRADSGDPAPTAPSSHDSSHENTHQCAECSETEDIKQCSQCGVWLCWNHRREFPPNFDDPWCPACVEKHNRAQEHQRQATQATSERVAAAELSTSRASSAQQSAKVEKKQGRRGKKEDPEPEPIVLSPEAEKIWRAWCSLFTVEVELIKANAAAAEKLVKPARVWCGKLHWTLAQWLKAIKDNAYAADNKGYYSKRGVKLFDIPRELEGWQSAKEHELSTLAQAANPKPAEPPPVNPTLEALRQQRLHYTGVMS